MKNPLPKKSSAEDFAKYVAENKPHLIEIEEEIQKVGPFGQVEIKVYIRGGRVEKLMFYGGRTWIRGKQVDSISTP